ncbi:MAG: mitochondrial aspartate-glutamate transporter agc1 [Cyphobasidiales sp. Tagirdzhanova-0007]|nr:MAG: mitochondrial aspartate-glutamate transporter agc1 [Cyphobasidiales sp. Tagirdzhanova-0007]
MGKSFIRSTIHCEAASAGSSNSPSSSAAPAPASNSGKPPSSISSKLGNTIKSATQPAMPTAAAELAKWRATFNSNAKVDAETGDRYLDQEAFVNAIAPKGDFGKIHRDQFALLFKVADTRKKGRISMDEFVVFETILKKPDAPYEIAFRWFDTDNNGMVSYSEFQEVFKATIGPDAIPFDFDSPWVALYLGKKDGVHVLDYPQFAQFMKGLPGERLRQSFHHFDTNKTGYIRPDEFAKIIQELARHKLSDALLARLTTLCTLTAGGKISYSEVIAFHNVIVGMDSVERIVKDAISKSSDGRIDRADFLNSAAQSTRYSNFTPLEASIIFHFAGMGLGDTRLAYKDFGQLIAPTWERPDDLTVGTEVAQGKTLSQDILRSAYNFLLGGVAGGIGASAVYPIDLVKTRMQNQRSRVVGELLYKNGIDCAKKVYKNEGFRGFYKGLPPQLIGVAPEKAIKLTMNDLVRGKTRDPDTGTIKLYWEILAGGIAGASQVVFTNPLEIVKIRLQMQGETVKATGQAPKSALHIIKQLGLFGLYKGASACLLRDVPFSAIYFTSYAHLKKDIFRDGENGKKLSFLETLSAAGIAGMPSAYLTTPADVIKTRLQSEAKKGFSSYTGNVDAFTKILAEEGPSALFKGGIARVIRSSPQFGVTLVAYETLQTTFPYSNIDKTAQKSSTLLDGPEDITRVRGRNALKILLDVHENISLPKN